MKRIEENQIVYVIDDDSGVRNSLEWLLGSEDLQTSPYPSAEEFLEAFNQDMRGCILLDVRMQGMNGLVLQQKLKELSSALPIIILTGHANVTMAVTAMKQGAFDFLRKPYNDDALIECVKRALEAEKEFSRQHSRLLQTRKTIDDLTDREREGMDLVVKGFQNKQIAEKLGISNKTVEAHRARVMKKCGVRTLTDLVKMVLDSES